MLRKLFVLIIVALVTPVLFAVIAPISLMVA